MNSCLRAFFRSSYQGLDLLRLYTRVTLRSLEQAQAQAKSHCISKCTIIELEPRLETPASISLVVRRDVTCLLAFSFTWVRFTDAYSV